MSRWPSLAERKPQHLSVKRASAASTETLQLWFDLVNKFLEEKGLLKRGRTVDDFASRIWNADETGFCLGATSKKILARKGSRSVHEVGGASDHQYITVNACGNAAGVRLPPFILYKGKNLYTSWTKGGPAGAVYGTSQSGWMEEANYMSWFDKQFYPAVKHLLETGPVVLFIDGHYSHSSLELITRARSLGIHLFCLPPNTTHLLQPLDIGVFGPVKQCWRKILKQYKIKTRATNVTKEHFPELIKQLYDATFTAEHLQSAFRAAGLVPFNPQVHSERPSQIAPSLPTSSSTAEGLMPETPLRKELREYFRDALKPTEGAAQRQKRRMVKVNTVGEVLTSDEVIERLEQADAERAAKKKTKKKGRTTEKATAQQESESSDPDKVYCGSCGQLYTDAESNYWVGCDTCDSWWHYWCVGFTSMPSEEEEWVCEFCQQSVHGC